MTKTPHPADDLQLPPEPPAPPAPVSWSLEEHGDITVATVSGVTASEVFASTALPPLTRPYVARVFRPGPWAPCDICGGLTRCRTIIDWYGAAQRSTPRHMACDAEDQDQARRRSEEQERRDERRRPPMPVPFPRHAHLNPVMWGGFGGGNSTVNVRAVLSEALSSMEPIPRR